MPPSAKRRNRRRAASAPHPAAPASALQFLAAGGDALRRGDAVRADELFARAIAAAPDHPAAWHGFGLAALTAGRAPDAAQRLQRAAQLAPRDAQLRFHLGVACQRAGRLEEAVAAFLDAFNLSNDHAAALANAGILLHSVGDVADALEFYRSPAGAPFAGSGEHARLAAIHALQTRYARAMAAWRASGPAAADALLARLETGRWCPVVPQSVEAIDRWRSDFAAWLAQARPLHWHGRDAELNAVYPLPIFYLPYQGRDNLDLKRRFAALFDLAAPAPTPNSDAPVRRIGLHVGSSHAGIFRKHWAGLLDRWTRDDLPLTILTDPAEIDPLRRAIANPRIRFLRLPADFMAAVHAIRQQAFDLLYFWEVGSDSSNYFLPFFRLAPVQCTSAALPDTTGHPAVDWFVSWADSERPDPDHSYTERLFLPRSMPRYYRRPGRPDGALPARDALGLPAHGPLFLCAQPPIKCHPDFDPLLAGILRGAPDARIVLFAGNPAPLTDLLVTRWRRVMPELLDRILILPRRPLADYLAIVRRCDVVLDTPHYGGGTTMFEAFALGQPVVTLPGEFMRGRFAAGCLRRMGIEELIARDPADYVRIALRLALDPGYRGAVASRIARASDCLFEDEACIAEHERFFEQALGLRHAQPPLEALAS